MSIELDNSASHSFSVWNNQLYIMEVLQILGDQCSHTDDSVTLSSGSLGFRDLHST